MIDDKKTPIFKEDDIHKNEQNLIKKEPLKLLNLTMREIIYIFLGLISILLVTSIPIIIKQSKTIVPMENNFEKEYTIIEKDFGTKRIQILDPFVIRLEPKYNDNYLNQSTLFVPNREEFKGIEKNNIKEEETDELHIINLSDSRYEKYGIRKVKINITVEEYTKKGFNGVIIQIFGPDSETPLYSYNLKDSNLTKRNTGELPNLNEIPYIYELFDAPRITTTMGYQVGTNYTIQPVEEVIDVYLLINANDAKLFYQNYRNVAGPTDFVRLSTLGAWDSRYHRYTQWSAQAEVDHYAELKIPLDNLVIDTDWRLDTSKGYGINTELFPDIKEFFKDMHDQHIEVQFNDHPEPAKHKDRTEAHVFEDIEIRHRTVGHGDPSKPYEYIPGILQMLEDGLDYWWYDRNWKTHLVTPTKLIDLETFGAYLYHDATRLLFIKKYGDEKIYRRPVSMSNVDNIKNGLYMNIQNSMFHQFPLTWTGDIQTKDLHREIKNVIKCAKNSVPYMSSDIGGHADKTEKYDEKLYIRWIQYGTLSPIFRIHPTQRYLIQPQPWNHPNCINDFRNFVNLRYRLLPLFYRLAYENYMTGIPICQSDYLYYKNKDTFEHYQWMLGKSVFFAPISEIDGDWDQLNWKRIYFPGDKNVHWYDMFHGQIYEGGQEDLKGLKTVKIYYKLSEAPLFVRMGSITPLVETAKTTKDQDWNSIAFDIYPGNDKDDGFFYEDDFHTTAYRYEQYRKIRYSYEYDEGNKKITIKINGHEGELTSVNKLYKIRYHKIQGFEKVADVQIDGKGIKYDEIAKDENSFPFEFAKASPTEDIITFDIKGRSEESHTVIITLGS